MLIARKLDNNKNDSNSVGWAFAIHTVLVLEKSTRPFQPIAPVPRQHHQPTRSIHSRTSGETNVTCKRKQHPMRAYIDGTSGNHTRTVASLLGQHIGQRTAGQHVIVRSQLLWRASRVAARRSKKIVNFSQFRCSLTLLVILESVAKPIAKSQFSILQSATMNRNEARVQNMQTNSAIQHFRCFFGTKNAFHLQTSPLNQTIRFSCSLTLDGWNFSSA